MLHTQVDLKHFLVHVQTRDGTQGTVFTCADEGWKSIFICYVTCANEGETQCNIHLSCNFDVKLVQIRSERQYMQYSFVMQLLQMRSETVQLCNLCKWGLELSICAQHTFTQCFSSWFPRIQEPHWSFFVCNWQQVAMETICMKETFITAAGIMVERQPTQLQERMYWSMSSVQLERQESRVQYLQFTMPLQVDGLAFRV